MSQAFEPSQIKQQLSKFINLLQNDFQPSTPQSSTQLRTPQDFALNKNLSIIFSASEPESSSLDKENSNPSANRSFDTAQKPAQLNSYSSLLNNLLQTKLNQNQQKAIERLGFHINQLEVENEVLKTKISQIKSQHKEEKTANDEMLNVLVKLDQQEKQLWSNYNLLSGKYQESQERSRMVEGECEKLKENVVALHNDNQFMKKLIFHANQNYEALERKCHHLEENRERDKSMYTERASHKKSSMDNLLKSAKTKKNGFSPSHSELGRTPSPDRFQDVYRKMIIRTLKFKGKNQ